jgi:hypothetical protein
MSWLIAVVLAVVVVVLWMQLQAWKKWAADHKAWQGRNCRCQAPGGDPEPVEPKWP